MKKIYLLCQLTSAVSLQRLHSLKKPKGSGHQPKTKFYFRSSSVYNHLKNTITAVKSTAVLGHVTEDGEYIHASHFQNNIVFNIWIIILRRQTAEFHFM